MKSDKPTIAIFWFRRDLRLQDNAGLYRALQSEYPVLPIFIFDTHILKELSKNDARVGYIVRSINAIQEQLGFLGKGVKIFFGTPEVAFELLLQEYKIAQVYTNRDYEPYAQKRDMLIYKLLATQNISFETTKDQVIFEQDEVTKTDGTPYLVYTPYMRAWKAKFGQTIQKTYPSEQHLTRLFPYKSSPTELSHIKFEPSMISIPKEDISEDLLTEYERTRDIPHLGSTSHLGIHLRFGTVSIRLMVEKAMRIANDTFLNELIWREFFSQILWSFPHTVDRAFKAKYDHIKWRNNQEEFKKWCNGQTGYPIVDAGMRQLLKTGMMHNRVRMIVASFLCKHLLIDWRWGESYFAQHLLDFELASNVGNWQWVAGCGVDAAPYFRIFNPTVQTKKFDSKGVYIKQWLPSWNTLDYPPPMVDHAFARQRCLETYKKALGMG